MNAPRIPLELSIPLGTADPIAFFNKFFREATAPLRQLLSRAVERLGVDNYDVADEDNPKRKHRIRLKPSSGAGPDELKLKFCIVGSKIAHGGETLVDEARRMAIGQPRGPKVRRSLDGGGGIELIDEDAWRVLGSATAGGVITQMQRSLDGEEGTELRHFEPITMTALLAIAVPILIALIPVLLPMVLDGGSRFIENLQASGGDVGKAVSDTLAGKSTGDEKAAADAAAKAAADAKKTRTRIIVAVAGVAALGGAFWFYRSRKG